jgi:hypothetical protein
MRWPLEPLGLASRPEHFRDELASSYVRRLTEYLDAPAGYLRQVARFHSLPVVDLAEIKVGLAPATLVAAARFTDELRGRRFVCPACASGELVEVAPHFDYYCCLEHETWVGPAIAPPSVPDRTRQVSPEVAAADVAFRAMRGAGDVSIDVLAEAAWIVGTPGSDARKAARITPANYTWIVDVIRLLTNGEFLLAVTDPAIPRPHRHAILRRMVLARVPTADVYLSRRLAVVLDQVQASSSPQLFTGPFTQDAPMRTLYPAESVVKIRSVSPLVIPHAGPLEVGHLQARREVRGTRPSRLPARRKSRVTPVSGDDTVERTPTRYRARLALGSLAVARPDLAAEWHTSLNGTVTPSQVTRSSNYQKYWWHCSSCGHDWPATTNNRSKGRGCPAHHGRVAVAGRSLRDVKPDLAREWDHRSNDTCTPEIVTPGSGRLANWTCPAGHTYPAKIDARSGRGTGCPVCLNRAVVAGVNDLATTHPGLVAQWAVTNGVMTPADVVPGSRLKVQWRCARHRYTWPTTVQARANSHHGCPVCANRVVLPGHNDLATTRPDVARYWVPFEGEPTPSQVTAGSGALMHWACTNGEQHTYPRMAAKRCTNDRCPICTHHLLEVGFNDLATLYPSLATEWHPTLNGTTPDHVMPGNKPRWWLCRYGHLTHQTVPNRKKTFGCADCPRQQRSLYRLTTIATQAPARFRRKLPVSACDTVITVAHPTSNEGLPMAQRVQVLLTSDLSGDEATETVTFALDGASYETDLTESEGREFRDALARFVKAGRRTGSQGRRGPSGNSNRRSARGADYDPAAVRKWAEGEGIVVSPRGRISADVLKKFRDAGN